ncbi:hypothetical protein V5799_021836 [Amblyomma americanum]|uniref:Uncharacterized protein n=1 Tax=Amblyomma americanum TaxID=6943 RepID=A0AAQ4FMA9_AMBAM
MLLQSFLICFLDPVGNDWGRKGLGRDGQRGSNKKKRVHQPAKLETCFDCIGKCNHLVQEEENRVTSAAAAVYRPSNRGAGTDQRNIVHLCILEQNNEAGSDFSWAGCLFRSVIRQRSWSDVCSTRRGIQRLL